VHSKRELYSFCIQKGPSYLPFHPLQVIKHLVCEERIRPNLYLGIVEFVESEKQMGIVEFVESEKQIFVLCKKVLKSLAMGAPNDNVEPSAHDNRAGTSGEVDVADDGTHAAGVVAASEWLAANLGGVGYA